MKKGYISIIIPVYNEEKYLDECLESVINQTYRDLEIIIINDGSTDGTDQICSIYAARDKRIKYIKQSNQGVASAKRKGVELAEGEYIGFVDGDDYIDKDMYERMFLHMKGVDLVTSRIFYDGRKLVDLFQLGVYDTPEQMRYFCENMVLFADSELRGMLVSLNNKLFVADILKSIISTMDMSIFYGEDAEIVYKYVLKCNAVCVTDICGYHYRIVDLSITHSVNLQYMKNVDALYFSLKKVFEESDYRDVLLPKLEKWIWKHIQIIPHHMGWKLLERNIGISYLNPYLNQLQNKKIILYGAGVVGKDYYKIYQRNQEIDLVSWVDEKCDVLCEDGYVVEPVNRIMTLEYDYILIGVKKIETAEEIKKRLKDMGIPNEKILWKEPIGVSGLFMLR